jgi:hypothetical protein
MSNSSKQLFQSFVKKGMSDRDAIFAVIDHLNQLHWYDRDRYHERIKQLEDKLAALEGKPA